MVKKTKKKKKNGVPSNLPRGKVCPEQGKSISPGRHEYHCTICSHADREEIEQAFVDWSSLTRISKQYGVSRDSVYRHAHALGFMERRRRNVRAALERIIESAGEVKANATAIVSAVSAYAKINASGQWVERIERVNLNELFERMSVEEMEAYAAHGKLPPWFEHAVGATGADSQGSAK